MGTEKLLSKKICCANILNSSGPEMFSVIINVIIPVNLWLILGLVNGKDGCKNLVYLPCVKNKILKGHVIKTLRIQAPGFEECQFKCFIEKTCVSYNLGPVEEHFTTCELNDQDNVTHPSAIVPQQDSQYCPIENPCSSNPCESGQQCTPDFYNDNFICSNGTWTQWSAWCKCPTTRSRARTCRNPFTNVTAADCPGPRTQNSHDVMFENVPESCLDALQCGCSLSGVYNFTSLQLFCDQETNGGGWTVIQRRQDGSQDFYLGWQHYKVGFGNLTGEFWLGLDKIHQLTQQSRNSLRVDLEDTAYAEYDYFAVDDEANKYRLSLGNYTGGNAGDSLGLHRNSYFSTKDREYDSHSTFHCAVHYKAAWWYTDCHYSHLNGQYLNGNTSVFASGIVWDSWKGFYYSAKKAEMKIRPTEYPK